MDTIHLVMASEVETISELYDLTKVRTTDVTASQQQEASKRFISETGMGRLIIKT